jgi:hypothetical protein
MYIIMQAVEEMLGPHHIARLERLTYASLTRCVHIKHEPCTCPLHFTQLPSAHHTCDQHMPM